MNSSALPRALSNLIDAFGALPGVGARTAERYAYAVLKGDHSKAAQLSSSLAKIHNSVKLCPKTFALIDADQELSSLYTDPERDRTVVAVVEEPFDVVALENTHQFKGTYHVLGGAISPIDGLLLVVIGITRALVDAFSARSYLVLSTLAMTLVISLRQPGLIYLLLLPITLLTALGMEVLISKWYSLFPRNPYARGTAVVMLSVLVMAVACTSLMQYLSNQNYSSTVAYGYNMEFRMVRQEIRSRSNEKVKLVVSSDQLAFYQVMQRNYPNLSVVDTLDKLDATTMILASSGQVVKKTLPSKIITSWHSNDPVLVRIYSK